MYHEQFTEKDLSLISEAPDYATLAAIAVAQLERMVVKSDRIGVVCGPISTGGAGSIEANIRRFAFAVDMFKQTRNGLFFSQIEYEEKIWALRNQEVAEIGFEAAGMKLLEGFYLPVFESGMIHEMYFLPDWQTSTGATWERKQGERLGIRIHDIESFYDKVESGH